jgi:hypothetical protein
VEVFFKLKKILFQPNKCWDDLKKEKSIKKALYYLIILLIIGLLFGYIISILSLDFVSYENVEKISFLADKFGLSINILILIFCMISTIILFILTFIYSGLLHLIIKLFKGEGNFIDTYKAFVYGATPQLLLAQIPYINQFSWFYMIYLQVIGLSKLHNIKIWKVSIAYISLFLIIFSFTFFLLIFFIFKNLIL